MFLKDFDPEIFQALSLELQRQQQKLELIASENFVSVPVLRALGSVLTNKYAEGYPGKRYYGGCEYVDIAENLAIDRAKKLFNCEYANVQPHSGSSANMGVYFAFLNPGDTILSMNLSHGGHLTHGSPVNFSGKFFKVIPYGVREDNNLIDYDMVEKLAVENKPKMIVAGFSAYPRKLDFKKFREIADKVGALLMADVAHPAGLIAAGLYPDPIPYCDIVTTTTHKTLRGPRGGMIMSKECHADVIKKNIFPGIQGGPLMHVIAAKAVAFKEALSPEFKDYQKQTLSNASVLADALMNKDFKLVSGGTDNHLMLLNLTNKKITGKKAEEALDSVGITVNKNMIPFDQEKPFVTSGIRIGTPALTTRGMKETEMKQIADFINRTLEAHKNQDVLNKIKGEIIEFSRAFPLYPELNQPF